MNIYKRGDVYHYEFQFAGQRHRGSTGLANRRKAEIIANARRTQYVKFHAGLAPDPGLIVPTLKEFEPIFLKWLGKVHRDHPSTREFYTISFSRLLDYPELANAKLTSVDAAMVERFKDWRVTYRPEKGKVVGRTTINRYLATLRKALYHAHDPLKLIPAVPTIPLYPKSDDGCERERDYVFTDDAYKAWLAACPEPLRSASILARNCGICRGELLALQTDCLHLLDKADEDGMWGEIDVKRGLKRQARRRTLIINEPMRDALAPVLASSRCQFVFTALTDARQPLSVETLGGQARDMKRNGQFHSDAGLHALRHTFLTQLGETVDVFTLKKIAGHSSIKTTEKYVHPQREQVRQAFVANMGGVVSKSPQNPHSGFVGSLESSLSHL
jgi:integrase